METTNLNKSLSQIFKSKYIVPLYQRNFAWEADEIGVLLQDLYESFNSYKLGKRKNYFIGSLVVLSRKDGYFEVIDGQQRLTTITLIAKIIDTHFAKTPQLFYESRPEVESFFAHFYDTGKTDDITFDYKVSHLINAVDIIKDTIINPDENKSKTILNIDDLDEFKLFFSENVILVRVEIPNDTDVANYFEIMNNRGEQLQKHEILKSKLMDKIKDENGNHERPKQNTFSQIWDACSQIDIPIQKLFKAENRAKLFGEEYDKFIGLNRDCPYTVSTNDDSIDSYTITKILSNSTNSININEDQVIDIDDEGVDKSIVDFPNFLMHVFRLKYNDIYKKRIGKETKEVDIPLNEKYLLSVYKVIEQNIDSMYFIQELLCYRTVFDRYVIKSSEKEDAEDKYVWSLEKPRKYIYEYKEKNENKYRISLKYESTFKKQERIVKTLSLLQVTFRSRKYKNWLQELLSWFSDKNGFHIEMEDFQQNLDNLLLTYFDENFLSKDSYANKGVLTPHFIFNFIDYLYWVDADNDSAKSKFSFDFKYRNSIEHHLPQSLKNEENKDWIDNLGNLCLISKSANSKMSNEQPKGKASSTDGKYYKQTLPPKRKIMYDITNTQNQWTVNEINEHSLDVQDLINRRKEILFHKK